MKGTDGEPNRVYLDPIHVITAAGGDCMYTSQLRLVRFGDVIHPQDVTYLDPWHNHVGT